MKWIVLSALLVGWALGSFTMWWVTMPPPVIQQPVIVVPVIAIRHFGVNCPQCRLVVLRPAAQ